MTVSRPSGDVGIAKHSLLLRLAEYGDKTWGRLSACGGSSARLPQVPARLSSGTEVPRRLKPAPHCLSTGEQDMDRVERKPRLGVGLHHARNGVGVLMMPPPDPALNEVLRR